MSTPYTVPESVAAQAQIAQYEQGEEPELIALAATVTRRPDGASPVTFLRASELGIRREQLERGGPVYVKVPRQQRHRIVGGVLLGLGGLMLVGIGTVLAKDLSAKSGDFKGFASALVGASVGPLCLSLLITGGGPATSGGATLSGGAGRRARRSLYQPATGRPGGQAGGSCAANRLRPPASAGRRTRGTGDGHRAGRR